MYELIIIALIAFIFEFFDASIGMGYGTTITSFLILFGFAPLEIIPTLLFTNAIMGLTASYFHHEFKNISFKKTKPRKITTAITICGTAGVIIAVLAAVQVPENWLRIYIGLLVLTIGIFITKNHHKKQPFRWSHIIGMSTLAGFNKGLTAGGYGSVVVGGQIISGVESKKAVAIASLAEGIISIIGLIIYWYFSNNGIIRWDVAISLLIGGLLSIPLATYIVKKSHPKKYTLVIGIVNIILGSAILTNLLL